MNTNHTFAPHPPRINRWSGAVFVCVMGQATDPEDADVQGVYKISGIAIEGCDDGNIDLDNRDHIDALAWAALHCFHSHTAIEREDDFIISVLSEDGANLSLAARPPALKCVAETSTGPLQESAIPSAVAGHFSIGRYIDRDRSNAER